MTTDDAVASAPENVTHAAPTSPVARPARRWRGWVFAAVALVGVGFAVSAVSGGKATVDARTAGLATIDAGGRLSMPVVTASLLGGGTVDTSSLLGHVSVINFWASWCAPCREEAPVLEQIRQENAAAGMRMVGVDVQDNPAAARVFISQVGMIYPSIDDADGQVQLAFSRQVQLNALPVTVFIDKHGRIAAVYYGLIRFTVAAHEVAALLAE